MDGGCDGVDGVPSITNDAGGSRARPRSRIKVWTRRGQRRSQGVLLREVLVTTPRVT